jgi:polar amino acid transport system permease protein
MTSSETIERHPEQGDPTKRIVPYRRPGRWVAAAVSLVVVVLIIRSLVINPNVDVPTIREYLFSRITFQGIGVTLLLTAASMIVGVAGAVLMAVMRLSDNPVTSTIARLYIWLFRGTPVLVQLIFWGYLGVLFKTITIGIPFTDITFFSAPTSSVFVPVVAAIAALSLNEVAYSAEIIRGGILSVSHGQVEAASSLGMTRIRTMRRIILPQAMRFIIPPMGNQTIGMLKTTSLVSVIGGKDLLTNMQNIYSQTFQVIPLLIVASLWYLILVTLLSFPQRWLERRYERGVSGLHGSRRTGIPVMWRRGARGAR